MSLVDLINSISSWAQSIIGTMGYPGLALVMFLENIFPPIPSEIILPLAGFMTTPQNVTSVHFTVLGVTLVGCLGSLVGAWTFYGLAAWFGEERIRWLVRRIGKYLLLKETDFDNALKFFNRYHSYVIFFRTLYPDHSQPDFPPGRYREDESACFHCIHSSRNRHLEFCPDICRSYFGRELVSHQRIHQEIRTWRADRHRNTDCGFHPYKTSRSP